MATLTSDPTVEESSAPRTTRRDVAVTLLYKNAMLLVLAVLVVTAAFTYDNFLEWNNFKIILVQNAGLGIIAVGVTLLMVTGAFDLSVVPVFVLGAAVYAAMADDMGWGLALVAALLAGSITGVINGFIVAKVGVNSFIATLATASAFAGIVLSGLGNDQVTLTTPSPRLLGTGSVLGIPIPILLLVAVFLIGQLVLGSTAYGRRLKTVGGSEHAARLAGLRVERLRVSAYVIVGICACLAGVVFVARLGSMQATQLTNSAPLLLDAIAIVVVGGTSLYGGEGAVWRTAIGLLIFGVLDNVIAGVNASAATEQIVKGVVVLFAVITDLRSRQRSV
ncbi:ribose transport system permease protein [Geodermatophilus sabuli]|uniref:Ribose transport system permease protein n=2 Tax=Geodermatophilus sabuli TaxID=1564158 RepID=A0A285E936_9ACTN|nr:ribose transport system permease protein [Geodermatophilus sabuli]